MAKPKVISVANQTGGVGKSTTVEDTIVKALEMYRKRERARER